MGHFKGLQPRDRENPVIGRQNRDIWRLLFYFLNEFLVHPVVHTKLGMK